MERSIQLSTIVDALDLTMTGSDMEVQGLNLCNRQTQYNSILSYATSEKYLVKAIENLSIKTLVLTLELHDLCVERYNKDMAIIKSNAPEADFYAIHDYLYRFTDFYNKYNFPAQIGINSHIHPAAVIENGVIIGDNVTIGAYSVIKNGTVIGNDVNIGCNSTIGAEGFQVIIIDSVPKLITHTGSCHISDGVTILNNVVISKSLFEGATFIGKNVKINSLVSVDHNCRIEKNAVLTASVNLCGSSYVQSGAWLGTSATVLNNVTVGENALLGIGCIAIRDIPDGAVAVGNPARIIR